MSSEANAGASRDRAIAEEKQRLPPPSGVPIRQSRMARNKAVARGGAGKARPGFDTAQAMMAPSRQLSRPWGRTPVTG
jgi:hypothetical protein